VSSYEAEYSEREYDYTAAAWEAYAEAIEDAKAVVENPSDYSLAEADAALTALNNAVTTLLLSTLNTSTLRTSIATAELILIDEDSYIPSYVTALSNALAAAESALVARTSQAQVNAAANALGNVITAKHPKGDLTVLRALDLSTRLLDVYHFTAASWAVLESALEASGDVIAQGVEADTDEVETALTALYNAIDDLVVDVPRRELSQIISGADKILEDAEDSDKYIPAAVANLDAVITAAKAVMENSASSDAALRAQTANLSEAILNLYEKGDKTALQSLYDTLNGYDGTLYTPESWATFRSVLSDIADVIADPNATKEDVSEASRILTEAKAALVEKEIPAPPSPAEKGDKTALQAFYDTLNSYDGTLYTLESWSAFRSLLSNVESVLANPDATKEDVGGAAGKLIDAKNALVQKEVVTPPVTDNRQQAGTIPTTQTPAGNDPQTGTTPGTDASARVDTVDSIRSSQKTIYLPVGKKSVSIPVMTYYTGSGEKPVPTWISNKPLVAKVSSTGKIIPLKAGTAKLTIAAGGKALTLTVKVVKKELNAKKITLKKPPKSLKTGQSAFLTPSISSGKATGVVKWSSSNKKVLKVDKAGKVTALKKGTAKITVKIGKVKRTYSIKVT
jgi:hypothetical protein